VERHYDLSVVDVEYVRHGENTTFRVRGLKGDFALRLYRPGYQSEASIRSELAWTEDLRRATTISTPGVLSGRDGEPIQRHSQGGGYFGVMFEWCAGRPLGEVDRPELWRSLGRLTAIIHEHGQTWRRPANFTRPSWDLAGFVGDPPRWGDPLELIEWTPEQAELLRGAREMVRRRLLGFGTDPECYGLIHADMAFENVLVDDTGQTVVIDFDDGGPGWFAYDLAVSLFVHEGHPTFDERRDWLVGGYREVRELTQRTVDELPTFLMARRLATLGWTATRAETAHASGLRSQRIADAPGRSRAFLEWAGGR
jgi:Ser/Thr protein kinase RdoA (MazF antagonist)